jgi:hypothetical protein
MYTGRVVRLRLVAVLLALVLAATPVLGVVCQMDCDHVPATPTCHESASSPDGSIVRSAQHACNHDHSTGSPALLASAGARDLVGTFVALPLTTLADASVPDARVAILAMHGPPGLSGRSTSPHTTVLRI